MLKHIYTTHNGTLKDNKTPRQSGSGSNGNEEIFYQICVPKLKSHHRMNISVIPRTPFFLGAGDCSYPSVRDSDGVL